MEGSKKINSFTEEGFLEGLMQARQAVQQHPSLVENIEKWVKDSPFWARYLTSQWSNTLGYMGSSAAEANHSSVVAFCGSLYDEPVKDVMHLIQLND